MEMFGGVALGLLLLIIGYGADNEWLALIGVLIMPLALMWGALFKSEDSVPVKVTLLAISGLILVVVSQGVNVISQISSLF